MSDICCSVAAATPQSVPDRTRKIVSHSVFSTQLPSRSLSSLFSQDVYIDPLDNSFSLFQFMQCLFAAAAFFYSSYASMTIQLAILATMLVIGVAAFLTVEVRTVHKEWWLDAFCVLSRFWTIKIMVVI